MSLPTIRKTINILFVWLIKQFALRNTLFCLKRKKRDINKRLDIQINNHLRHRSHQSSCNQATWRRNTICWNSLFQVKSKFTMSLCGCRSRVIDLTTSSKLTLKTQMLTETYSHMSYYNILLYVTLLYGILKYIVHSS